MIATALKVGLVLAATQPTVYEIKTGADFVREIRVEEKSVTVRFRNGAIDGFAECYAEAKNLFDIPFNPDRAPRLTATISTWLTNELNSVYLAGAVVKTYDAKLADDRGQTVSECGEDCVVMPARLEVTCN